jgi:hypothetical protein
MTSPNSAPVQDESADVPFEELMQAANESATAQELSLPDKTFNQMLEETGFDGDTTPPQQGQDLFGQRIIPKHSR